MSRTRRACGIAVLAVLAGCATSGTDDTPPTGRGGGLRIYAPPPALRLEIRPSAPAPGLVWLPGYWDWHGADYAWVGGRWVPPRRGSVWAPPVFLDHGGGYLFVPGHWQSAP